MGKYWPRFLQCILQPLIPNPIDTEPSTLGGERESGVKGWLGAGVEILALNNNRPVGLEPSLHNHHIATTATLAITAALATTATCKNRSPFCQRI
jgi:hypothetical protein